MQKAHLSRFIQKNFSTWMIMEGSRRPIPYSTSILGGTTM